MAHFGVDGWQNSRKLKLFYMEDVGVLGGERNFKDKDTDKPEMHVLTFIYSFYNKGYM